MSNITVNIFIQEIFWKDKENKNKYQSLKNKFKCCLITFKFFLFLKGEKNSVYYYSLN